MKKKNEYGDEFRINKIMFSVNKNEKCNYCKNYLDNIDKCKFCQFEYDEFYTRDDWDILDLDCDMEWTHLQILYRLHSKGLPCLFVDIWSDNNLAILLGCNVFTSKIADVLGVHEECIYNWSDQSMIIINLYMEKDIRKKEKESVSCEDCGFRSCGC